MNAIDLILNASTVDASAWRAEAFEAEMLRASRCCEIKAALLDVLAPAKADTRRGGFSALFGFLYVILIILGVFLLLVKPPE